MALPVNTTATAFLGTPVIQVFLLSQRTKGLLTYVAVSAGYSSPGRGAKDSAAIVVQGSRPMRIGQLASGTHHIVTLTLLPLRCGMQRLPTIHLISDRDSKCLDSIHDMHLVVCMHV